jgi:ABC-type Mn2+/Zn2+ transport system ATPase subunit
VNAPVQTLLSLEGLAVGYDRQPVLQDLNLRIAGGSFTGLLGANGSGKTTLIKTVLGILPPLAGRITFTPIDGCEPVLGYTPQHASLDPIYLLSSLEVVLMGVCGRAKRDRPVKQAGRDRARCFELMSADVAWARIRRSRKAGRDWARYCLQQAGADQLGRRQFAELSGGQKQRVLIARALATKPDFLLLDEPTAGIDVSAKQSILDLLCRLHEEQGHTILLASHDLAVVRQYARQAIWLHDGKALEGPAAELLAPEEMAAVLPSGPWRCHPATPPRR